MKLKSRLASLEAKARTAQAGSIWEEVAAMSDEALEAEVKRIRQPLGIHKSPSKDGTSSSTTGGFGDYGSNLHCVGGKNAVR